MNYRTCLEMVILSIFQNGRPVNHVKDRVQGTLGTLGFLKLLNLKTQDSVQVLTVQPES